MTRRDDSHTKEPMSLALASTSVDVAGVTLLFESFEESNVFALYVRSIERELDLTEARFAEAGDAFRDSQRCPCRFVALITRRGPRYRRRSVFS
jgi:hypothetical protein